MAIIVYLIFNLISYIKNEIYIIDLCEEIRYELIYSILIQFVSQAAIGYGIINLTNEMIFYLKTGRKYISLSHFILYSNIYKSIISIIICPFVINYIFPHIVNIIFSKKTETLE